MRDKRTALASVRRNALLRWMCFSWVSPRGLDRSGKGHWPLVNDKARCSLCRGKECNTASCWCRCNDIRNLEISVWLIQNLYEKYVKQRICHPLLLYYVWCNSNINCMQKVYENGISRQLALMILLIAGIISLLWIYFMVCHMYAFKGIHLINLFIYSYI